MITEVFKLSGKADQDIYDDFKSKKNIWSPCSRVRLVALTPPASRITKCLTPTSLRLCCGLCFVWFLAPGTQVSRITSTSCNKRGTKVRAEYLDYVDCLSRINASPFNRQGMQFEFSPTWSCDSLTRSTTSSEWKLFRFDKMEVNYNEILVLPIDVTFYL